MEGSLGSWQDPSAAFQWVGSIIAMEEAARRDCTEGLYIGKVSVVYLVPASGILISLH